MVASAGSACRHRGDAAEPAGQRIAAESAAGATEQAAQQTWHLLLQAAEQARQSLRARVLRRVVEVDALLAGALADLALELASLVGREAGERVPRRLIELRTIGFPRDLLEAVVGLLLVEVVLALSLLEALGES